MSETSYNHFRVKTPNKLVQNYNKITCEIHFADQQQVVQLYVVPSECWLWPYCAMLILSRLSRVYNVYGASSVSAHSKYVRLQTRPRMLSHHLWPSIPRQVQIRRKGRDEICNAGKRNIHTVHSCIWKFWKKIILTLIKQFVQTVRLHKK